METTKQKKEDWDANSSIWYLFRDFVGITPETSTDEKWSEIVSRANDTARKYQCYGPMIHEALVILEDRAIGETRAKVRRDESRQEQKQTSKVMSLFRSLAADDQEKIMDLMRLYKDR